MMKRQTVHKDLAPLPPAVEQPRPKSGVVVVRTLIGFEVWLDAKSEESELTASGALLYRFAVTSPGGEFAMVRVEIPAALQDATRRAIGPRFADDNAFWHALACDALTDALEEEDTLLDERHLIVERLTPSQFDMALRW